MVGCDHVTLTVWQIIKANQINMGDAVKDQADNESEYTVRGLLHILLYL
jgi:hypothetical protein